MKVDGAEVRLFLFVNDAATTGTEARPRHGARRIGGAEGVGASGREKGAFNSLKLLLDIERPVEHYHNSTWTSYRDM